MEGSEEPGEGRGPSHGLLEELLQGARAADQEAWRVIVGLYAPFTHRWCQHWGMQPCDAEDLVQEVFLAAAQCIHRFQVRRDVHSFRDWLRGIARNKMLEFRRRRSKREQSAIDLSPSRRFLELYEEETHVLELDFPATYLLFLAGVLESVRSEFEDASWQAFWITMVDERTSTEAAAELGMSPDAVRMCKHRVLRRLKQRAAENAAKQMQLIGSREGDGRQQVLRGKHTSADEMGTT